MFSSFYKLLGISPVQSNTNALSNTMINAIGIGEAQTFADYALNSPYPIVRALGEIVAGEPYAFFVLIVGVCFVVFLFLRWTWHIVARRRHSANRQIRRAFKEGIRFLFSWQPICIVLLAMGVFLTGVLNAPYDLRHFIRLILFSLLIYMLYRAVFRYTQVYFRMLAVYPRKPNSAFPKSRNLRLLAYRFIQSVWVVVFVSIFLGLWGMQLTSILAGLGIAGVVAGLAMQDTFSHLVGGVTLMLDEAYSVGDVVKLENGIEGVIFEIGLRSTKIRTWDEEVVSVPNGVLSKMTITNMSQPVERKRVRLIFQVDATTAGPELITEVLYQSVNGVPSVLLNPEPFVSLLEIKGNALVFRVVFYVDSVMIKISTADAVYRTALVLFEKHNIRLIPDESLVRVIDNK